MHSHDKTLISSLGFNDPDKKNARHDLACQYLATEVPSRRLMADLIGTDSERDRTGDPEKEVDTGFKYGNKVYFKPMGMEKTTYRVNGFKFERPIIKGDGKYASVVGFLDLVILIEKKIATHGVTYIKNSKGERDCESDDGPEEDTWETPLFVEVKIQPIGTGDIIRQINLYRSFIRSRKPFVVALDFPISKNDKATLENERIKVIRLGPKFDEWIAEQSKDQAEENVF